MVWKAFITGYLTPKYKMYVMKFCNWYLRMALPGGKVNGQLQIRQGVGSCLELGNVGLLSKAKLRIFLLACHPQRTTPKNKLSPTAMASQEENYKDK